MKLTWPLRPLVLDQLWYVTTLCYSGVELPTRLDFDRMVRKCDVFVREYGSGLVGYGSGLVGGIAGYALVDPSSGDLPPLLLSIAVMPLRQGTGIGKDILREVTICYLAQKRKQIVLRVKTDNATAQVLYLKEGYRVTAYLRNYYKPEGDGLEMRKIL